MRNQLEKQVIRNDGEMTMIRDCMSKTKMKLHREKQEVKQHEGTSDGPLLKESLRRNNRGGSIKTVVDEEHNICC